jgi:hypothetical protein
LSLGTKPTHSACAVTLPPPSAPQKQRWTSCAGPGAAATLIFKLWNEAQEVHGRGACPFGSLISFLPSALQRGRRTSCAGPGAAASLPFESWHKAHAQCVRRHAPPSLRPAEAEVDQLRRPWRGGDPRLQVVERGPGGLRTAHTPLLHPSSTVHSDHGEVPTFKLAASSSDTTLPFLPFQVRSHPCLLSLCPLANSCRFPDGASFQYDGSPLVERSVNHVRNSSHAHQSSTLLLIVHAGDTDSVRVY